VSVQGHIQPTGCIQTVTIVAKTWSCKRPTVALSVWWCPTPAAPRRPSPPLPLLPSGPDGVYGLSSRGHRRGSPLMLQMKTSHLGATHTLPTALP